MMKKSKGKKNEQHEQGPEPSPGSSETTTPDTMSDEADPTNRTVLAAITALRNEIAQIKDDICATLDSRIQTVYTVLREELATSKKDVLSSITILEETTASHGNSIKEMEKSATYHSDEVTELRQQVTQLKSELGKLTEKCEDLEGRSRRHNIRITGIPEGAEGSKPRDFIAGLLQDLLSLDEKPLIDRAHRTLRKRPGPNEPPRPFVLRLHYYHVLEDIIRRATAAKQLSHDGKRIQIFPDYPPTVAKRRALFNRTRELLRAVPGLRYGLLYPARLLVTYEGKQTSFTDPEKAQVFAERLSASGSATTHVEDN